MDADHIKRRRYPLTPKGDTQLKRQTNADTYRRGG